MQDIIIIDFVIVTLVVLTIILYILLKRVIKNINENAKKAYLFKLQQLNDQIEKPKEVVKKEKPKEEIKYEESGPAKQIIVQSDASYSSEDFVKKMKEIERKFKFDNEKLVLDFIKNNMEEENMTLYNHLNAFKDALMEAKNTALVEEINKDDILALASDDVKDIITKYFSSEDTIDPLIVLERIDIEIRKCDPTVYVLVGLEEENYDYINKCIQTVYDQTIYKGVKIYYHNKLFDYSLD